MAVTAPEHPGALVARIDAIVDRVASRKDAWGNTIWQLWDHNKTLPGAEPFVMTQATAGSGGGCSAPAPTLESAVPGQK